MLELEGLLLLSLGGVLGAERGWWLIRRAEAL
jgi:hypothetical protein